MRRAFTIARANAKRRGIPWALSFEQWRDAWLESGHWAERGRKCGQYHMDRKQNLEGYVPGNIQIIAGRVNRVKDSPHGWHPKLTERTVREIRAQFSPRIVTKRALAERFGVSTHCIKAVLNGNNWKGLP